MGEGAPSSDFPFLKSKVQKGNEASIQRLNLLSPPHEAGCLNAYREANWILLKKTGFPHSPFLSPVSSGVILRFFILYTFVVYSSTLELSSKRPGLEFCLCTWSVLDKQKALHKCMYDGGGWMDGWMDGWMEGWMDQQVSRWMQG